MKKLTLTTSIAAALISTSINTASALEFGVFSDIKYSQSDAPGRNGAFQLGALDFYATASINDKTRIFIEYVFEDPGNGLVTDLERLWITRTFSNELSLGLGRFHTPLGTWNRTYHHGAILQDTVSRPFFLDFEDGEAAILPTHIVGALASGTFTLANGELGYETYLANGPSLNTTANQDPEIEINVASDPNSAKTLGLRLTYAFDELPLQLGLMYMSNAIAESAVNGTQGISFGETLIDQNITGFDIKADTEQFDFLMEYYSLANDARVGNIEKHTLTAYYTQFGYKLNETNKIIYRYASLDGDTNDDFLTILGVNNANHQLIAYRLDLDESNSLKLELNQNNPEAGNSDTTITLQWAFIVP